MLLCSCPQEGPETMAQASINIHMGDDLSTANASILTVKRLEGNPNRIIAYVYIGETAIYFESLAQINEVIAVLEDAGQRFADVLQSGVANEQ